MYRCLDGHTDIWTDPSCIVIFFVTKSFNSTAISGYPVISRILDIQHKYSAVYLVSCIRPKKYPANY